MEALPLNVHFDEILPLNDHNVTTFIPFMNNSLNNIENDL